MTVESGPYRIGVDVGGTNTDAAIIDIAATDSPSRGVCASSKTPTTVDVTSGIYTVIENVLCKSTVQRKDVLSVAIGTTHFVNAVVQADAQRLNRVAVVRLCGPFTRQVKLISYGYRVLRGDQDLDVNKVHRFRHFPTFLLLLSRLWVVRHSTWMEVSFHG